MKLSHSAIFRLEHKQKLCYSHGLNLGKLIQNKKSNYIQEVDK